jgi:hypothetical protein
VLLESIPRLILAMVKSTIDFLSAVLDLLAYTVVLALGLAQFRVLAIALLLQLGSVVASAFKGSAS